MRVGFAFATTATAIVLAAPSSPVAAGGFGIPEVGVRRTAMASIIGRPDDLSAIYHNPAGLVLQHGWQLYASLGLSRLSTRFQLAAWNGSDAYVGSPGNDGYYPAVRPRRAYGVIPMLAASAELVPDRLVIGAALFVGNATGAAFADDGVTRYHLIDAYVVAPEGAIAAAYRFSDALSLGASLGVIDARVHLHRIQYPVINGADVSRFLGKGSSVTLDGSDRKPVWTLAAFGRPLPHVSWGASVTGRVDVTLSGQVELKTGGDVFPAYFTFDGTQTTRQLLSPWTFAAGGNVDVTPQVELGAEGRYWLYRQYKVQRTEIKLPALEPLVPAETLDNLGHLESRKDYRDSWQVSGGARVHDLAAVPALEAMAGVQYDRSPAPSATVTLDQPSFTHWGAHAGLRYQLGRYRIGASYIHYWYQVPTITDSQTSPPTNMRGSGGNNIVTASLEVAL